MEILAIDPYTVTCISARRHAIQGRFLTEISNCEKCVLAPYPGETCFCGKKSQVELLGHARTGCEEERKACQQICGAQLVCGHKCSLPCHAGECRCSREVEKKCRCGCTTNTIPCNKCKRESDGSPGGDPVRQSVQEEEVVQGAQMRTEVLHSTAAFPRAFVSGVLRTAAGVRNTSMPQEMPYWKVR